MRLFLLFSTLVYSLAWAQAPQAVLNRCQGEGCDCYAAYRDGRPKTAPAPTLRPFTLYAEPNLRSAVLGRFPESTLALPLGEKTVVLQRGEYRVHQLRRNVKGLRPRDTLHTLLSEGEGFASAQRVGSGGASQSVDFSLEDVELRVVSETRTQAWVAMKVGTLQGFAPHSPYSPFEGCLE